MNRPGAKFTASALLLAVLSTAAHLDAAPLQLRAGTDLALAEIVILNDTQPGFLQVAAGGQITLANASVILGAPAPGTFSLIGNPWTNIIVTLTAGTFACDTAYLGSCTGTPTLSNLQHNFSGVITEADCPQRPRCQETVSVGARFGFNGGDEGRWTNTITVVANYQ